MEDSEKGFICAKIFTALIIIAGIIAVSKFENSKTENDFIIENKNAQAVIGKAFNLMTVNGETDKNKSAGDFVNNVVSKYLNIEKTCNRDNYADCGFPRNIKRPDGKKVLLPPNKWSWSTLSSAKVWDITPSVIDEWTDMTDFTQKYQEYTDKHDTNYFFRTTDGVSVSFLYNPHCASDVSEQYRYYNKFFGGKYYIQQSLDTICLMGIYDINGSAKPNQVGKDIGFIGSFYKGNSNKIAAVLPYSKEIKYDETGLEGSAWDKLYNYCKNQDKDLIMPDVNETSLLYLNQMLVRGTNSVERWFFTSSSLNERGYYNYVYFDSYYGGRRHWVNSSFTDIYGPYVRCVKRTNFNQ